MLLYKINFLRKIYAGLVLGLHTANERHRYFVMTSLIVLAQSYNQLWYTTYDVTYQCSPLIPQMILLWHGILRNAADQRCGTRKRPGMVRCIAPIARQYSPVNSNHKVRIELLPNNCFHYCDVIMGAMASQISSLTIVNSTIHSGSDQRKQQSSTSLAFVRGFHRWPVNSPHKWPVTRKMFPFDDVIMFRI